MKSEVSINASDPLAAEKLAAEKLAAHAQWIAVLARELIKDPHTAEDLAQQTLVRALEKGPREPAALRSWLRKVLRNLFYERLRTGRNREAREAEVGSLMRAETATDDVVSRMQTAERMSAALQSLEEPFRSTLFLRFYDDLAPREIASKHEVSVATVKSRLHRGLARLRLNLDDEYGGDRQAWIAGCVALSTTTSLPLAPAAASIGGLAMNMKAAVIAVALALAGGLYVTLRSNEEAAEVALAETSPDRGPARSTNSGGGSRAARNDAPQRTPLTKEASSPTVEGSAAAAPEGQTITLEGQAFDGEGGPLAAIPLRIRGESEVATRSEASGAFRFETTIASGKIDVAEAGWVTIRSGSFDENRNLPPVVVAAPAIRLAGQVVDEWGQGLSGARITVSVPDNFERRFPVRLDASAHERFEATATEGGSFALSEVPFVSGAVLRASHPGYQPLAFPLENRSDEALLLQLALPVIPEERALRGVVLRENGSPASEAHVALGATTVPTSSRGEFTIDLARVLEGDRIIAIEKGSMPAVLDAPGPASDPWPDDLILQLGAPALSLSGVVLSADGKPVSGARVWIADGSSFGVLGNVPLQREALMAGAPLPKEGVDFLGSGPTEDGNEDFGNHMPLFAPNAILNYATTDLEGHFELPGLDDRTYTLHVLGPDLASAVIADEARAGDSDLVLRMDAKLTHPHLRGQVRLANGDPVAGVLIYPFLPAVEENIRILGGSSGVTRWFSGPSRSSDEEGRFEFGPILNLGVNFYIESDEIVPSYASMDDVVDPGAHTFEVVARLHAQAELLDPTFADELAVFDEDGESLILRTMRASGHTTWERIAFDSGRTGAFVLTSEAVELRLYKAGEVVGTHPLSLRMGELNLLRY